MYWHWLRTNILTTEIYLIILPETWLTTHIPDVNVELPGFTTVRADRDTNASRKRKTV